jgi:hypothetical protein
MPDCQWPFGYDTFNRMGLKRIIMLMNTSVPYLYKKLHYDINKDIPSLSQGDASPLCLSIICTHTTSHTQPHVSRLLISA